jgi:HlyD family secretion protein
VKKKVVLLVALAAIIIAIVAYNFVHSSRLGILKLSGNIEATEVRLAFQVPGRITELLTDEGHLVKKGDVVARIDKSELTAIRDQAAALLKEAQSESQRAAKDLARTTNLSQNDAISAQERDAVANAAAVASAKLVAAGEALKQAEIRLQYGELTSTLNGFVIAKSAEAGEVVQIGQPVFSAADLHSVWLTAYVSETDLGRVKLGQAADVSIDTFGGKTYKGQVTFISEQAEFTPKQIQTAEERVKLVYRIKITLSNPDLELKPGMPADAVIKE